MPRQLLGTAIAANTITTTQLQTTIVQNIEGGGGPRVTSLIYPGDDTAANTVGGQTVYINGSGFASNSAVYINGNSAPSVSFISSSNLAITTPALSAATYPVYVINPENGATAIFIPGLLVSGDPTWVTSAGSLSASQDSASAWSYSVSATSDSAVTYALASGSSLPTGISLAANGLISGTMSSPPESETTYNFTVEATDAENQNATRAFSVTVTTGEGVLFANNVLLIHADGTNNGNNHAFVDSSNNNLTITRSGNATQGSYSPFSQTGWSGYFDGSGDYLTTPSNAAFGFGTGAFTIEAWVYPTNNPANGPGTLLDLRSGGNAEGVVVRLFSNNVIGIYDGPNNTYLYSSGTVSMNTWSHIAIVRSNTSTNGTAFYINGVASGTTTLASNLGTSWVARIGSNYIASYDYYGYMSNLRLVKGSAVYTDAFTPPSAPLAPIANTSLLALQSNRLVDDGPNNFTLTRNGDVSIQPFSPFAPGLLSSNSHSVYFDGSGDWLLTSSSPATLSGDFTVEGWVYITSLSSSRSLVCIGDDFAATGVIFAITDAGKLRLFGSNSIIVTGTSQTVTVNSWNHIAFVRSSGTIKLYLNGVADSTTVSNSTAFTGINRIGGELYNGNSGGTVMLGYISNYRLVNGTAVYTTNFTPPTTPLTAITNTVLLTCQSPTFVDNSINGFTITPAGNAVPRKFNPFGQTYTATAYSTANVGGSVYLDGSGDYLTPADSTATDLGISQQPFTLEWWTYFTTTSGGQYIISKGGGFGGWNSTTGWQYVFSIEFSSSVFSLGYYNGSSYTYWQPSFSSVGVFGRWNHMVLSYDGTNLSAYVNGTRIGTTTVTNFSKPSSSNKCGIGSTLAVTSEAYHYNGYISDFRIVQGNAVYDPTLSTLTVPTAPLTNVANTSLLLNFTNAGIFDQTAKNVLETLGDAKVSTAQYKYGTASMYFDGTGDYLVTQSSALNALGSGDFTIEMWLYPSNTNSAYRAIIASDAYAATTNGWTVYQNGTSIEMYYSSGGSTPNIFTATSALTSSVWQHFALVRSSGTLKAYVNGTQVASVSNSINFVGGKIFIGDNNAGDYFFNGYIDDLRITRGYARYTSNFTPPAAALKDK